MDAEPDVGLAGGRLIGRDGELAAVGADVSVVAERVADHQRTFGALAALALLRPRRPHLGRPSRRPPMSTGCRGPIPSSGATVLDRVGGFDPRFFLYTSRRSICAGASRQPVGVVYWPQIEVVHIGGESSRTVKRLSFSGTGSQLTLWRMRSQALYYRKHHGLAGRLAVDAAGKSLAPPAPLAQSPAERPPPSGQAKAEESAVIVSLWARPGGHPRRPNLAAQPW
jgi:GT2 family glycosyltransferase